MPPRLRFSMYLASVIGFAIGLEILRAAWATDRTAARRALGPQILADAARLVAAWNARQVARTPCCSRRRSVPPSQLGIGSCG